MLRLTSLITTMTSYIDSENSSTLVTRVRRVSKSGFLYESNSKSPRLDKMIAHINLFDQTTKKLEEDITRERQGSLAQKRINTRQSRSQPGASEYYQKEEVPAWVTELTSRPAQQDCIVVSEAEVEEVEDVDNDGDWGARV